MGEYQKLSAQAQQRRQDALARVHVFPPELTDKPAKDVTAFPRTSGVFSAAELDIVAAEADEILRKTRDGAWSSLAVTKAFIKAASIAQQLTNCLTETLFPEALARAQQLDDHLASTGSVVGPLHGLPVSLKDCFVTPPHPSSLGFAAWANEPTNAEDESVLVKLLRGHGAVLYCKTNVPTAMMMMETDNRTWGQTLNPSNLRCSAGGSSGGEGALLAMQGSPLGVGTDIGGSIRIPAAYNGLYSLKPSFSRLPAFGVRSGIPGNDFILAVNGPMARSLSSLRLYCAALLADGPLAPWHHDPKCIPLPWRAPADPAAQPPLPTRPLRLGFLPPHDGVVSAHPPVARALATARAACLAAGHTVLDWSPAGHADILRALIAGFLDLGGPAIGPVVAAAREPWFPAMAGYAAAADAPAAQRLSADELRRRNVARNALQRAYLERWRAGDALGNDAPGGPPPDALVAPVSPWAAVRAGLTNTPAEQGGAPPYFGYTAVWSFLDLPAATFPVTRASAARDAPFDAFAPLGELDARIQADYDPHVYDGAPAGLQAVGERLAEERLLDVVAGIRRALEALPPDGADAALLHGVAVGTA